MKPHTRFALTILIILAVFLAISLQYKFRTGLMVWIVLSITILLLAAQIWRETAGGEKNKAAVPKYTREYLVGAGWIVIILPMVFLFGFLITVFLYSFAYLKVHNEKWLLCISLSIILTAIIYGVFEVALGISLYKGLLLSAI